MDSSPTDKVHPTTTEGNRSYQAGAEYVPRLGMYAASLKIRPFAPPSVRENRLVF